MRHRYTYYVNHHPHHKKHHPNTSKNTAEKFFWRVNTATSDFQRQYMNLWKKCVDTQKMICYTVDVVKRNTHAIHTQDIHTRRVDLLTTWHHDKWQRRRDATPRHTMTSKHHVETCNVFNLQRNMHLEKRTKPPYKIQL